MKKFAFGALALLLALGCGQQQSSQPQASGDATSGESSTREALRAKVQGDSYVIAVIPKGLVHQFWLTVKAGAESAGQEFGGRILWRGPNKETDIADQISIVEDMITKGVDGIVLAACDKTALVGVIQKAVDAKIPVVTIDSGVDSDLPVSFVATDNVKGAELAADELARLIGNKGDVGLIPFIQGAATSVTREEGFKKGIAKYPDIKLAATQYCQSDVAKALTVTEDMMQGNPNLVGIFAANEPAAMGAAQAIKRAGKTGQIKLVAFDAAEEEVNALKDGSVQALIVQNPYRMGYLGVKAVIDHLKGNPVEKSIDTGVKVVTAENLNTPEIQELLNPTAKPAPVMEPKPATDAAATPAAPAPETAPAAAPEAPAPAEPAAPAQPAPAS